MNRASPPSDRQDFRPDHAEIGGVKQEECCGDVQQMVRQVGLADSISRKCPMSRMHLQRS
jgi:hypothetical protein